MATIMQVSKNDQQDIFQISNLQDLKLEINKTKALVKSQETALKTNAKKLPLLAATYAGQAVIKIIVKKGVPLKIVSLISNGVGLVMAMQRQKKGVQNAITKAKEFVVFTALNKLASVYQKKRNSQPEKK